MSSVDTATDGELRGVQAWPTLFFTRLWKQHAVVHTELVATITRLKEGQPQPVASGVAEAMKPAEGLHEGDFDLFRQPDECLVRLGRFVKETVAAAARVANGQTVAAEDLMVRIIDSWYHVTNGGGSMMPTCMTAAVGAASTTCRSATQSGNPAEPLPMAAAGFIARFGVVADTGISAIGISLPHSTHRSRTDSFCCFLPICFIRDFPTTAAATAS